MAINLQNQTHKKKSGFTLLIAVIFSSVFLAIAITMGSLGYKQSILTTGIKSSQDAFYAADFVLECALYEDSQNGLFEYSNFDLQSSDSLYFYCGDNLNLPSVPIFNRDCDDESSCPDQWVLSTRVELNNNNNCADLKVYKYYKGVDIGRTYVYSTGYNVSCSTVDDVFGFGATSKQPIAVRGLYVTY
jgi:hypothetical protein